MFDSGKVDLQKMLKEAKPEEKIKIEVLQKQLTETQAKYDANVESVKSDVKLSSSNDTTMKNLTYDVKKGILQNGKLFS